jgi:hypothetical protein
VTDGEGGSLEEAQLDALITKLRQDRARATTAAIDSLPAEARVHSRERPHVFVLSLRIQRGKRAMAPLPLSSVPT